MSSRIGLEVRASDVHGVLVQSGAVLSHATATFADSASLATAVDAVLVRLWNGRSFRPSVVAAIGASRAQVKRLDGLPSLAVPAQMTQLLQENAGSVFLRAGGQVTVPDAYRASDGSWWGAALDRSTIEGIVAGTTGCGLRVSAIVPVVIALAQLDPNAPTTVEDGTVRLEIVSARGELRELRRTTAPTVSTAVPSMLQVVGDDAPAYVGAYAAAMAKRRSPLAWRPESAPALANAARRARRTATLSMLGLMSIAAIAAPGVRATLFINRAAETASRTHGVQVETSRTEAELRRTTQLLETVDGFDASRGQMTRLLGELTQALPESTAIVTLRADSTEGSFIAVSPHVTDVLGELGAVDQMLDTRIVGSVTRETVAGVRLERATFRFRRPRVARVHR